MGSRPLSKMRIAAGWASSAAVVAASWGCAPHEDLRVAMEAYAPADRIRAVKAVAERGERQDVPGLVDRLDDEDVAVRMAAIAALDQLTGMRLGYDAWAAPASRVESINAWRSYIAAEAVRGEGDPAEGAGVPVP